LQLGPTTTGVVPTEMCAHRQEYVREQAEQCGEMLKRLGVLAEAETDEATLQQTLELHSALEQAMAQYDVLLAVAEARSSPSRLLPAIFSRLASVPQAQTAVGVSPRPERLCLLMHQ